MRQQVVSIALSSLVAVLVPGLGRAGTESAPPADHSVRIASVGQPSGLELLWGVTTGYAFEEDQPASRLDLGLQSEFLLPQFGFLDVTFEGSVGYVGSDLDGGISASLRFPYANPGLEYNLRDRKAYLRLTALGAPRRGGLLSRGDRLRLDYIPATQSLRLGFTIQQPFSSFRANRPRNRHVYLDRTEIPSRPYPDSLYARDDVEGVRTAMGWMDRYLLPRLRFYDPPNGRSRRRVERALAPIREHARTTGRMFTEEDSLYHAGLDAAFAAAAGGDPARGRALAVRAEAVLLDQVLIPVDRLFGRLKKPVELSSFERDAIVAFQASPEVSALDAPHRGAAIAVLRRVLEGANAVARTQKERWDDSRLVWLPLNYGLRAGQLDSQEELNGVLARLAGSGFSGGGDIRYLLDDDFFYQYRALLLETLHYQVTIIHDFRNRSGKAPDVAAWEVVSRGYLEAFIRAIKEMDEGTREDLPEFFLFLDEHYYRENRSARVINYLERLHEFPEVHLDDPVLDAEVAEQMARLKEAVTASPALGRKGEEYLRGRLKVQINITQQFNPTFKEDAMMRDHRKIAFRDVFEDDPGSGVAVFTGMGIGEHYLGPTWEDRALLLRGPELVNLKLGTRDLFMEQGYAPEDVPRFLRPRPFPPDYAERCRALEENGWTTRTLIAMNAPGFRDKEASVFKMALYNLMPPGSLLLIPDSIWSNDFWGSILLGGSLRGLQIFALVPDRDHAPSDAAPTLELIREIMASMALARETLSEEMARTGGGLHVGVFCADYDVCDPRARVEAVLRGNGLEELARAGWKLAPATLARYRAELDTVSVGPRGEEHVTRFGSDRDTKLHQKTQFLATREGMEAVRPEAWTRILDQYLAYQRDRCRDEGALPQGLSHPGGEGGDAVEAPSGRSAYFMTAGSQNQDRRGMLLDGEVLVGVAGKESLMGLADLVFIVGTANWIQSVADVNACFPPEGGLLKSLTRWIRNLI
jgi:hypothetical protein